MYLLCWSSFHLRMAESNFICFENSQIHSSYHCFKKQELNFFFISISSAKELISILKLRLTNPIGLLGLLTAGHESFLRINVSSIDQEISTLLCTSNIHCHCHNSQPLNPILSHPTAENELKACFCETCCSIILSSSLELSEQSIFSGFQIIILRTLLCLPSTLH
jgi:hypothetical protein